MDLTVYHVPMSRSVRVLWLLQELGLPYKVETLEFIPGKFGGDAYTKIDPLNQVPALRDGDMVMNDSIAIMQYILARYGAGKLAPDSDSNEYPAYLQWLQFGESGIAQSAAILMAQRKFFKPDNRDAYMDAWAVKKLEKQLGVLEARLGDQDYILKSGFSAADISVGYPLLLARLAKAHDQITPRIQQYWETLTTRPAWQRATAKPS